MIGKRDCVPLPMNNPWGVAALGAKVESVKIKETATLSPSVSF